MLKVDYYLTLFGEVILGPMCKRNLFYITFEFITETSSDKLETIYIVDKFDVTNKATLSTSLKRNFHMIDFLRRVQHL